jgi:HD-GYP domain-containing protein (c-di-GMP phosphodiesterase class II)
MRRLSVASAAPGAVLGRGVSDAGGRSVCKAGDLLTSEALTRLSIYGVDELFVEDNRLADVPVEPMVSPELEARAAHALRQLISESDGAARLDNDLLAQAVQPAVEMAHHMRPVPLGDLNTAPCKSPAEAMSRLPARAAGLAACLAIMSGGNAQAAEAAAVATLLMDVGLLRLPARVLNFADGPDAALAHEYQKHPVHSYILLKDSPLITRAALTAVLEHHERVDGSGYPRNLKGGSISATGKVVAIAVTYFELISPRPGQQTLTRHEAIEFIMAYAGQLFDPDLVQVFARGIPAYPAGISVRLNTGESGIVVDANPGHVGRPVVRILANDRGQALPAPYDVDLAGSAERDRMVIDAPEY